MKDSKSLDGRELNLITTINALEHRGDAPHTVEVLKKIYEETYASGSKEATD